MAKIDERALIAVSLLLSRREWGERMPNQYGTPREITDAFLPPDYGLSDEESESMCEELARRGALLT